MLILVVGGSVAWTVRQRPGGTSPPPAGPAPSDRPEPARPDAQRIEKTVIRRMDGDKVKLLLAADRIVGKDGQETELSGVDLTFHYMAQGVSHAAVVTSKEGRFNETTQKVSFRQDVVVKTDDGMELKTDALVYRADKQLAHSDGPVAFVRKTLSGTSVGMSYEAEKDRLELGSDVHLRIQDPDEPLTTIDSGHAVLDRTEGTLKFNDAVTLVQGQDTLKAAKLVVNLQPGEGLSFDRAQATDDVVLETAAGPLPGTTGGPRSNGPRRLTARKLDLWFHPNRAMKEAIAGPDADFTAWPGAGEAPEKRRLSAKVLTFRFDEQGRMQEVQAQKDASFESAPIPPAKGEPRTMTCQSFVAEVEPATGDITQVDFHKDVVFVQGTRKATANTGLFEGKDAMLHLRDEPVLVDTKEGSELASGAMDIATRTGDVAARRNVRHTLRPGAKGKGLLGAGGEPVVVTAQILAYDSAKRVATYSEGAFLRSGKSEIRAPKLTITQSADGKRRLEAEGGVASALSPRAQPGKAADAPIVGRAKSMVYDEAGSKLVYTGDASIRQGEVQTKSPEATLTLTPDGGGLQKLVAGEPVEVQQGPRRATGTRATYEPAANTMVITGDKVLVDDPKQQVEGRSVTFYLGDERMTVDGQDVRTETRIHKAGAPAGAATAAAASPAAGAPPGKPRVPPAPLPPPANPANDSR